MAMPQNVVYYDGVPYISNLPSQQNTYSGAGPWNDWMANKGTLNQYAGTPVDQMVRDKILQPMQQAPAPVPTPTRPPPQLSQLPQSGWGGAQAPQASLDAILNGGGQQFAAAPIPTIAPQNPPPVAPSLPEKPQRNFDQLEQNLMSQILASRGGM